MNWNAELRRVHDLGVELKASAPYDKNRLVPFILIPYDEDGIPAARPLVLQYGIGDEDRRMLGMATVLFRATQLYAAIIQSDATMARSEDIGIFLNIPEGLPSDEYLDMYDKIMKNKFGGSIANLPRQLWFEAVCTTIKGPKVPAQMLSTPYARGKKGEVAWLKEEHSSGVDTLILPDWWDEAVN